MVLKVKEFGYNLMHDFIMNLLHVDLITNLKLDCCKCLCDQPGIPISSGSQSGLAY